MIIFSIFREVLRRPLGAVSAAVLVALYAAAVFADFFAPYATNEQDLERTYHPPTALIFQDGGLQVQAYELVDPTEAKYEKSRGAGVSNPFLW